MRGRRYSGGMLLIGLTGGIASGKSFVAGRLEQLGAVHIDADRVAREVVEPGTPALARITDRFGPSVLRPDGTLDRPALGAIVFADEEKRLALNAIVHPAVRARTAQLFAEAAAADPDAIVVYNVPLLAEARGDAEFDLIVVVHAATETRLRRLIEQRGLSREEALQRISAQADDAERLAIADVVIDNDGDRDRTIAAVDALWARLKARSAVVEH